MYLAHKVNSLCSLCLCSPGLCSVAFLTTQYIGMPSSSEHPWHLKYSFSSLRHRNGVLIVPESSLSESSEGASSERVHFPFALPLPFTLPLSCAHVLCFLWVK